jgi:transposase InsO family protein
MPARKYTQQQRLEFMTVIDRGGSVRAAAMAIKTRSPRPGTVIHSDRGTVFTSSVFTQRAKDAGLLPRVGAVGSCYGNSMIKSFLGHMQTELLTRKTWRTRLELGNTIFEYLEVFHNRGRRNSMLGMLSPVESEKLYEKTKLRCSKF